MTRTVKRHHEQWHLWANARPTYIEKRTIEHCKDYFFRLFAFDAVLDETLAARDVDVELALLLPLTALTCLFYETIHVS